MWTNSARYAVRNLLPVSNAHREAVEKENLYFLDIGENLTPGSNTDIEKMHFWDKIFSPDFIRISTREKIEKAFTSYYIKDFAL